MSLVVETSPTSTPSSYTRLSSLKREFYKMDKMLGTLTVLCFLLGSSHAYSTALFSMLNRFNDTQQMVLKRLEALENISKQTSASLQPKNALDQEFEDRLAMLERRVVAIKKYLMQEKAADIKLKKDAKNAIDDIKLKLSKSKTRKTELETEIRSSIQDFNNKITNVNKTAHLTVNVKGVVFIGGIGSSCSIDTEPCSNPDSECRDSKCQCDIGLSFDNHLNECKDTCNQYGCTFQSARYRIIREHNNEIAENVTLVECKKRCIEADAFLCKSFDYFPRWKTCYLSASTVSDAPDAAWEYNSAGHHFQRDCLGIEELSMCNENQP